MSEQTILKRGHTPGFPVLLGRHVCWPFGEAAQHRGLAFARNVPVCCGCMPAASGPSHLWFCPTSLSLRFSTCKMEKRG